MRVKLNFRVNCPSFFMPFCQCFFFLLLLDSLSIPVGPYVSSLALFLSVSYFILRQVSSLLSLTGQGSAVSGRLMRGPLGDGVQTLSAHEGLSCSDVWLNCHRNQSCVWWVFRMTGHSGEGHQCFMDGQ